MIDISNLFVHITGTDPAEPIKKYLFLTSQQSKATKIIAEGFSAAVVGKEGTPLGMVDALCSTIDRTTVRLENDTDWISHVKDYVFIPVADSKAVNDGIINICENNGIEYRSDSWKLFYKKEYLFLAGREDKLKKEINKFILAADDEVTGDDIPDLDIISAYDLDKLELPPVNWIVDDILPAGLSIFSAPPKYYKSYACLDLGIAVATGGTFMGKKCKKSKVLYLDLESTQRRPQSRLRQILGDMDKPKDLLVITNETNKMRTVGDGFEEQISKVLDRIPDVALVIVDVYKKIRCRKSSNQNAYDRAYDELEPLKRLADEKDIALLLVHHNNRANDSSDIFSNISGGNGIVGSMDTIWILKKQHRTDDEAVFHAEGREVRGEDIVCSFDQQQMKWKVLGDKDSYELQKRTNEYHNSPIPQLIKNILDNTDNEWSGTSKELAEVSIGYNSLLHLSQDKKTLTKIGTFIGSNTDLFYSIDGITVTIRPSNRGTLYNFKK